MNRNHTKGHMNSINDYIKSKRSLYTSLMKSLHDRNEKRKSKSHEK